MNERIEKLWEKAAQLESDPSWEGQIRFMNKFAELIVRECADIADINQHQWDGAGNYVKQHFGVE